MLKKFFLLVSILLTASSVSADVRLPNLIHSNMVLQRDMPVRIWGWAEPGETVNVSFHGQSFKTIADQNGCWEGRLPPMSADSAGKPMLIRGDKELHVLENVVVGEVFFCSGQSNMEFYVRRSVNGDKEVAAANYPDIRILHGSAYFASTIPERDLPRTWTVCSPESIQAFSAVAYFFGRELHRNLNVPVGLIHCSQGGTKIEPWIGINGFKSRPALRRTFDLLQETIPGTPAYQRRMESYLDEQKKWLEEARRAIDAGCSVPPLVKLPGKMRVSSSNQACVLFNTMVVPVAGYTIRGVLWYQGESNVVDGALYKEKMHALVSSWREAFEQPELPFLLVQIAPYAYGDTNLLPTHWEAQQNFVREDGRSYLTVINDLGMQREIHPPMKQQVGARLAALAEKYLFAQAGVKADCPMFDSCRKRDGALEVKFSGAEALKSGDGRAIKYFEISGKDGNFLPAEVVLNGACAIVSHPRIPDPVHVRYAWTHRIESPNLVNEAGLPAAAFRYSVPE